MVKKAATDLINNVQIEMMRVRGLEVVGGEPDEHALSEIHCEKDVLQEHARHFITRVEAIITIQQWQAFEQLTIECKNWIHQQLDNTQRSLNYILSDSQKQMIYQDTHTLKEELGDLIDEYSIVKPSSHNTATSAASSNTLTLSLKNQLNYILDPYIEEYEAWVETAEANLGVLNGEESEVYLQQNDNGMDFMDEIQEIEEYEDNAEYPNSALLSAENFYLSVILIVIIALGTFLYMNRKKRATNNSSSAADSQVSKYKSLNGSFNNQQLIL